MRSVLIVLALSLAAPALAQPIALECGHVNKNPNKRKDMEYAWRAIAERCYAATDEVEMKDLSKSKVDINDWVNGDGANLLLLGKASFSGTTIPDYKLNTHAEKVGATLVVYWLELDSDRIGVGSQGVRDLSITGDTVTLSAPKSGGWALGGGSMKTTTGSVHALFLRDCSKAPCGEPEARPVFGELRRCEMDRCAKPLPAHLRFYKKIDPHDFDPTTEASVERIEGDQFDALVDSRFTNAVALGNTRLLYGGDAVEQIRVQALRVGATHALWWVEPGSFGMKSEVVVFLRDCNVAACVVMAPAAAAK